MSDSPGPASRRRGLSVVCIVLQYLSLGQTLLNSCWLQFLLNIGICNVLVVLFWTVLRSRCSPRNDQFYYPKSGSYCRPH